MLDPKYQQFLSDLEVLDFTGRGEAYVEQAFLTPLLRLLGYEATKDYEVIRHGDDGSAFKLKYPPVESGAVRVKHYDLDYIPTIRKQMFWVIEAKSPKSVSYPFDMKYLVQGLQYCIHPEIQAKYLLLTNGENSALYDAHGSVFLGRDMY
jgi:Type I restriction enzyme R protein N terminus (HSDR_N)